MLDLLLAFDRLLFCGKALLFVAALAVLVLIGVADTVEILPPESICTETYLIAGAFDTEAKAINYYNYLRTRFVRFLLSLIAVSQHITRASFDFVPVQDFTEEWTDEKLCKKYELT